MAVLFVVAMSLPGPARAQSDTDEVPEILLHPRVPTILKLPDVIVDARLLDRGEIRFIIVDDDKLYIRPLPGTPAGTGALLEVDTQTLRRTFQVRVVRRARDATRDVLILPPAAQPRIELVTPLIPPVVPAPPPAPEPAAPPPEPAAPLPAPFPAPDVEPTTYGATAIPRPRRIELSVHAVGALVGTSEYTVPGHAPINARQPHRALGMRVAIRRPGAWCAVEANVSGESPAAPTTHRRRSNSARIIVSGPLLRVDAGLRVRLDAPLNPSAYAGIGLQEHHRDIDSGNARDPQRTLPRGGVLTLGLGLEYRVSNLLLGLELHLRQGVPTNYHSVAALLSVGFFLDQGE